jgi:hypothetical protein
LGDLVLIVLPVFGLMAIGFAARASGVVAERTGDGLSDYVFALAVPCLLFKTLAGAPMPAVQPWGYWASYFTGLALVWAVATWIAARRFDQSGPARVVCGFSAAQSNTVLVGIPVILQAVGQDGAVPIALLLAVHLPLTMTAATLLAEGRAASLADIARKLATHPILVGIGLGLIARPFAAAIPQPAMALVDMIAATAGPCALISLGVALSRYGVRGGVALPAALTGLKLVVHPLIVFVLARHVFAMPAAWSTVAVLFAACPSGINAYLFAERYRSGADVASTAIALSTTISVATMVFWLWMQRP